MIDKINPNLVYREYEEKGGLAGISRELLHLSRMKWYNTPFAKELYQKAVEIYKKAFPHGKPPKNAEEVIRRLGVFASAVSRVKSKREHRRLLNLYLDYENICNRLRSVREQCEMLKKYQKDYEEVIKLVEEARKIVPIPQKVDKYIEAIRLFTKKIGELVSELGKISAVTKLWMYVAGLYHLGTTWFRFRFTSTYETGDERFGTRYLEDVVRCSTHAELVFKHFTEDKLKELIEYLLVVTDNEWMLNLTEEVTGIQLIDYIQGVLPKRVRIDIRLYDHNYSITRVVAYGMLPNDWQKYDVYDLLKMIEKTGVIEVHVVKGTVGRYKAGEKPVYEFKEVSEKGIMYKQVEGVSFRGETLPITKFVKTEKITKLPSKKIIKRDIRELEEKKEKKKSKKR